MSQKRITRIDTPGDGMRSTTTIITNEPHRSNAGTWLTLLMLVLLAVIGLIIFGPVRGAEIAKDHAIADAAGEVGAAAGKIGDAAGAITQ